MLSPTIAGNLTLADADDVRGTKHHSNNNFSPNRLFICQAPFTWFLTELIGARLSRRHIISDFIDVVTGMQKKDFTPE